jgi:hypothetical protein
MKREIPNPVSAAVEAGHSLEAQVLALGAEQTALLENASIQARYDRALGECVEQKTEQAEALEQRLEGLIERQQARLQQSQVARPGWLAMPSSRAAWQQQAERCQARLCELQGRLERVQDLHHGMGLYTPRLEELAERRLRAEQPELAEQWSLQRQAERALTESQRRSMGSQLGVGGRSHSALP